MISNFFHTSDGKPRFQILIPALIGIALSFLVLTPLLGHGWSLLLDVVPGPNPDFPSSFYGLGQGVFEIVPLAAYLLGETVNQQAAGWLPFLLFFPIALVGMYRLVDGSSVSKIAAGLFFCLTPVVFDRIWVGHYGFLLGYAFIPFLISSTRIALQRHQIIGWIRVAGWIALGSAASPHFLWIYLVLLIGVVGSSQLHKQAVAGACFAVIMAGLCSAYLLPSSHVDKQTLTVDQRDVAAFSTKAVGNEPLIVSVVTLRGFWREADLDLPVNSFPGRPVLLILGGLLIAVGAVSRFQARRRETVGFIIASVVAVFLAMGSQGPTGSIFMFLFHHLPGFAIMREPQKFIAVWAFVAANWFGLGLQRVFASSPSKTALTLAAVTALVVPAALSPGIFWGYGHRLHSVNYPQSWTKDNSIIASNAGSVLALPWHQYLTFPFLNGRIIANPASAVFERPVISGDNIELPGLATSSINPSSAYLSYLYSQGASLHHFGALVAPMNVRYIEVFKSVDWKSYSWLNDQEDLKVLNDGADSTLYENNAWHAESYTVTSPITVADWGQLVAYSELKGSVDGVFVAKAAPGSVAVPPVTTSPDVKLQGATRKSKTSYSIAGSNSAQSFVVTSEPYLSGWRAKTGSVTASPQGTVVIGLSDTPQSMSFAPWARYRVAYLISVIACLFVVLSIAFDVVSRRKTHAQG